MSLSVAAVTAQETPADLAGSAKLTITLTASGAASTSLRVFDRHVSAPLAPAANQLLGCTLENVKDRESDDDWVFAGSCEHAFRRRGLLAGGTLNFAPLVEALRQAKVEHIDVTIQHPRTGFTRFTDNGWTLET